MERGHRGGPAAKGLRNPTARRLSKPKSGGIDTLSVIWTRRRISAERPRASLNSSSAPEPKFYPVVPRGQTGKRQVEQTHSSLQNVSRWNIDVDMKTHLSKTTATSKSNCAKSNAKIIVAIGVVNLGTKLKPSWKTMVGSARQM